MQRPSKEQIKAALDKLKNSGPNENKPPESDPNSYATSAKKPNKNRIRKQGV